jgi:uncharacterized protein
MINIPPFDSTQANILKAFLDSPERSQKSMGYAEAAGFLFAVACAPELVEPSNWLLVVIDPDNAVEINVDNKKAVTAALMSLYNDITIQVQKEKLQLPPGVSFRTDAMSNLEPDAPVAKWAAGFKSGYVWLEKMWAGYIPVELKEQFGNQLSVLFFFSSKTTANSLYKEVNNPEVTWTSMVENMQRLFPDALTGVALLSNSIHQALATRESSQQKSSGQNTKVGRNEPCPCGSGTKYKKCCGASLH